MLKNVRLQKVLLPVLMVVVALCSSCKPLDLSKKFPHAKSSQIFEINSSPEGATVIYDGKKISTLKTRGNQGRATIPRVPQMYQSIAEKRVFPAQPRLSIRGSTHITVARGTPLWESLVGKPRGKVTDPLSHAKERVTLLFLLERKANVHAPTRDKD